MPVTASKKTLRAYGTDAKFRSFVHNFLAFSSRLIAIRAGFGAYLRLTGTSYTTLIAVAYLEGKNGVGINEVAEHLHLSGAFVTIEVTKLVKAGLIRKRPNPADRRRVLLTVSASGRQLLDKLSAVQAPVNDKLFGTLSAKEAQVLADVLPKLVDTSDQALALLMFTLKSEARGKNEIPASRKRGKTPKASPCP